MDTIVIDSVVDTGGDIVIIASESWHPDWPPKDANVQFLGIGTLSQVVKQSTI